MRDFFNKITSYAHSTATGLTFAASTVAATASAENILTDVSFEQGGGYEQFSNPEFVECAARAIAQAHPNQPVFIDDQSRPDRQSEQVVIGVIYEDKWLLDDGMFLRVTSYDKNGHIDRLHLTHRDGEAINNSVANIRPSDSFQHRFFYDDVISANNDTGSNLSSDFVNVMKQISQCNMTEVTMADIVRSNARTITYASSEAVPSPNDM